MLRGVVAPIGSDFLRRLFFILAMFSFIRRVADSSNLFVLLFDVLATFFTFSDCFLVLTFSDCFFVDNFASSFNLRVLSIFLLDLAIPPVFLLDLAVLLVFLLEMTGLQVFLLVTLLNFSDMNASCVLQF